MWYMVQKDGNYNFELYRGVLANSPVIESAVGQFLVDALSNVEHLKEILQRVGLPAAAKHFAAHVASRENVRIGDFGEVVAGHLLEDEEELIRPIEKLRYRDDPKMSMKLTDVFCLRLENDRIAGFTFAEAKAGTTSPGRSLGQQAYQQIYHDIEDAEPQILFFALDRLREANDSTKYLQLEEAMHRTPPTPRALRLVFVFDDDSWQEDVLSLLHDDFASGELKSADDFKCYVLTRKQLRAGHL